MQPENVNTASEPTNPVVTVTPTDVVNTAPEKAPEQASSVKEPDYKTMWEEESRRRAGLDRKLQRLSKGNTRDGESYLTGNQEVDDQVVQHPLVQRTLTMLADLQIKEGVRDLLDRYQHIPADVRKAIQGKPRGFINDEATNVDEGLDDIETYIIENYGTGEAKETTPTKEFPATQTNQTVVADTEREKSLAEMSSEELLELAEDGKVTTADLEALVKKQSKSKEVKKVK